MMGISLTEKMHQKAIFGRVYDIEGAINTNQLAVVRLRRETTLGALFTADGR